MGEKVLNVCFTANNSYAAHFCVSCYSLLLHCQGNWRIFLITDDFNESNESKIKKMISNVSSGSSLEIIRVSPSQFEHFPIINRLGIQAYFRLMVSELLPESIDSLLYLDSDLVVTKNLLELLPSVSKTPMMAVEDAATKSQEHRRGLNSRYFNSGVMMIPLTYWREHSISEKIMGRKYENIVLADQDMLNDYFNGQWQTLDKRLNVKGYDPKYMSYFSFLNEHKEAYIIHYMDVWKPWKRMFRTGVIYWKYLSKTPFRRNLIQLPKVLFNTMKHFLVVELSRKV